MSRNRKEIDKETMFKKIMPSAIEGSLESTAVPVVSNNNTAAASSGATLAQQQSSTPLGVPAAYASAPKAAEAIIVSELAEPAIEASASPAENAVLAQDASENSALHEGAEDAFPLVNVSRAVMEEKLPSVLEKFRCCTCEKCVLDILAISLNKIKPQYVMLQQGQSPKTKLSGEEIKEIVTALVQAVLAVKARPRH